MRHLVIGFVAVALSAGVAQARPRYEYRPPEVIRESTQPYHNLEGAASAHAKERLMKKANFEATPRPDAVGDSHASMSMSEGHSRAMPGSVKGALSPYHPLEQGAIGRGIAHLVQKLNATEVPVGKDGSGPLSAKNGYAVEAAGKAQPIARALNPYHDLEKKAVVSMMARFQTKSGGQASNPQGRPSENKGIGGGNGGMSGAVKATHEPYAPIEKAAVAAGIKHLMDKCNASAMPQGTKGNRHDIIAARESPAGGTARDAVASEAPGARTQQ